MMDYKKECQRLAMEAEHWLRLASKRQEQIDRLKKRIAKLKGGKS